MDDIEKKTAEKERLKKILAKKKYGDHEIQTRKQIDEIEKAANDISIKCERYKLKYQRLAKILVNARAGIEHLHDKLGFYDVKKMLKGS